MARRKNHLFAATALAAIVFGTAASAAPPATQPAQPTTSPTATPPRTPNMVLLYYGYDSRGPRDWTAESLKYYLGHYRDRGTANETATDTFFDTVLWMYRISSRGRLFETSLRTEPTTEIDWRECLDRAFAPGLQLHALEAATARLEGQLKRPVRVWVVLTLPYPDVRVSRWNDTPEGMAWDFGGSDANRLEAMRWYARTAIERWNAAGLAHLRLLGFYWFNEGHNNLRPQAGLDNGQPTSDEGLIRETARFVHSLRMDSRPLTLTWVPYSPYGGPRLNVTAAMMKAPTTDRPDYLMVQPNYFFTRHKKQRDDLVTLVRNVAPTGAGIEVEFDESLLKDETARQRLRDYLEVIPAEHPDWNRVPAGYYQGLRAVHAMATQPELAPLYETLYNFVRTRR